VNRILTSVSLLSLFPSTASTQKTRLPRINSLLASQQPSLCCQGTLFCHNVCNSWPLFSCLRRLKALFLFRARDRLAAMRVSVLYKYTAYEAAHFFLSRATSPTMRESAPFESLRPKLTTFRLFSNSYPTQPGQGGVYGQGGYDQVVPPQVSFSAPFQPANFLDWTDNSSGRIQYELSHRPPAQGDMGDFFAEVSLASCLCLIRCAKAKWPSRCRMDRLDRRHTR
jgi:hypothetical protein